MSVSLEVGKTYITEDNYQYKIVCYTGEGEFPYVGVRASRTRLFSREGLSTAYSDPVGLYYVSLKEEHNPYKDWPVDCKVRVKESEDSAWLNRHFAGVNEHGSPMVWDAGRTSHTGQDRSVWDYIERVD